MKGFVILVLAVGAAVAFLAPRAPDDEAMPAAAHVGSPETRSDMVRSAKPAWYGGAMVLDRAGDGHFYADVQVDTRDYRMLVDTGASVVALTGDDARDMGLGWDPNALAPVARGASGPVLGVPVRIAAMTVGDFEAHDVQAVIVPDGLDVSLLGQSFLRQVPKVGIAGDTLTLSD
jgi:aspartyl protease family protein